MNGAGVDGAGARCRDGDDAAGSHVALRGAGHWSFESGAAVRLLCVQFTPGVRHLPGACRPAPGSADVTADAVEDGQHSHPLDPFIQSQSRGQYLFPPSFLMFKN